MARVYEVGVHLLAVVDPGDTFADRKKLCIARVIARDGTKYDKLMDVAKCAEFLKHLHAHDARIFSEACDTFPFGEDGPRCGDIAEAYVWSKQRLSPVKKEGNDGCVAYLPSSWLFWSRWGRLVRTLRRDLALYPHMSLTPSEFALLIGDELDGRIVAQWFWNERMSSAHYEPQFLRIRRALDAMRLSWPLAHRHPEAWKFIRGKLPGEDAFVLELLRTDEGAARVMKYIAETADPAFLQRERAAKEH